MQNKELIPYIESKLRAGGIAADDVKTEAQIIASDLAGVTITAAAVNPDGEVQTGRMAAVNKIINARIFDRTPLQYMVPFWEWYGIKLKLVSGVLCPRQETELLVDKIREYVRAEGIEKPVIADLCTGSGNIAIALKKNIPDSRIFAVENSALAVPTFKFNCKHNNTDIIFVQGSVFEKTTLIKFKDDYGAAILLDVLVCNPPYLTKLEMNTLQPELKHEPEAALYGGLDGLDYYRFIIPLWKPLIKPGGLIIFEIGSEQARDVSKLLRNAGYNQITVHKDFGGNDRAVSARI
jgi:release factor glutamine methyltransferase